jgi:hypothetical protein
LAFCQVYISHVFHVIEVFFFCIVHKSSLSTGFAKQIMSVLPILCYNGSLVTRMVVSLTTIQFKPLVFYIFGFTLSYTANKSKSKSHCDLQSVNQ